MGASRVAGDRPAQAVIVTAWNRRPFLGDAIESVARSSEPPQELAVVANFREDALERRTMELGGRWIFCEDPRFGRTVTEGIRATSAPLISFLDDDDRYLSERLAHARRAFASDPSLGFLHVGGFAVRAGAPVPDRSPSFHHGSAGVPRGSRTPGEFQALWSRDAAYNGSSITVRREVLAGYLAELETIRLAVPPYLFFRSWSSDWGLRADPDVLVAIGQSPGSSTAGTLEPRSVRLARLKRISPALAADARAIRSILPAGTWDLSLREMIAMDTIFSSLEDPATSRAALLGAIRDLARRPTAWVPRGSLIGLALGRAISQSVGRRAYRWWTATGPSRVREPR